MFVSFHWLINILQSICHRLTLEISSTWIMIPTCSISPIFESSSHWIHCWRHIPKYIIIYRSDRLPYLVPCLTHNNLSDPLKSNMIWSLCSLILITIRLMDMIVWTPRITNYCTASMECESRNKQVWYKQLMQDSAGNSI
jgi:hypothetical protein